MPTGLKCPRCHHPLPSDAPRGLCPTCLLKRIPDDDPEISAESDVREPGAGTDADQPNPGTRTQTWNELNETVSFRAAKIHPPRPGARQRGAASTPSVDLDQLIASLIEVRLMEPDEVQAFLKRFPIETRPSEAEHLARELVRARRLTEYQAAALLQGKSRGLSIGNYLILDKLGRGGMGMVFKAQHRRMKRVVALKVLPPSYAREDSAVLRFQREVEAVARLGHPNIVAALDADVFNGLHFFAMEYVEGSDLTRLVREKGTLPIDQAIDFLTQAARGLKAAHDKGIYHRDIKPSNLILDASGRVKILDLGLARIEAEAKPAGSAESDPGLTPPGDVMGTVGFMPPEQAYDARQADHRSDIYSLGCTLYYLLTGSPPYSGVTHMACLLAHRDQPIPLLRDTRPDVPPILDAILQRTLAKAPEDRYPSIDLLMADLEAAARFEPELAVMGGSGAAMLGSTPAAARSRSPQVDSDPTSETSPARVPRGWRGPAVSAGRPGDGPGSSRVRGRSSEARADRGGPKRPARTRTNRPPPPPPPPLAPLNEAPEAIEPIGEVQAFHVHDEETRVQGIAVATDDGGAHRRRCSVGDDRTVRYWDVATGQERLRFAHDGAVFAGAFAPPDHRRALSRVLTGPCGSGTWAMAWRSPACRATKSRSTASHSQPMDFASSRPAAMAPSACGISRPGARSTGSSMTDPSSPWPSRP